MSSVRKDLPKVPSQALPNVFTRIEPSWSIPIAAILFFLPVLWAQYTSKEPQLQILAFALGGVPALACLAAGFAGFRLRRQRAAVLEEQSKLAWLNNLSGQDLLARVAEFYRRQQYWVEEVNQDGAEERADLRLRRDGRITLIRCKYWRTQRIGADLVTDLHRELSAEAGYRAVFITSGTYTEEALAFAQGKYIELIDAAQLDRMLRGLYETPLTAPGPCTPVSDPASQAKPATEPSDRPKCPLCGSEMVLRWSKICTRPGAAFWGCSRTGCSGAREME